MMRETNVIKPKPDATIQIDVVDRKLLRLLAEDASCKYADLGKAVNLTGPAVHERVKRLKRDGVITGTVATLDGQKIGCPLLAFVHVDTDGWGLTGSVRNLAQLADVEEIHSSAGNANVILKVRMRDTQALEALLAQIHAFDGVKSVRSHIVLNTYLERGPKPEIHHAEGAKHE